ncbi:hypothetical protein LGK95_19285 [Clostridium algoriphilum]|uniref:hypothetical protein n=1 Tax=Clostridium algoriphilum TaxID=198347 RepID=UPI001CF3D434|nr:hypothetical protein [Clostridium algoriphilum]MCB2295626.1 hypothetical protein [Clostridium algoriphilum]
MDEFKKELETINKYLENDKFNSIFPICERILKGDFSQNQKSQIYFILACTYKEIKNYEYALVNYSSCIKCDNNKEYAYVRKSELLYELNRFEAALVCCKQGLLIFNQNSILIEIKNNCVKQLCQVSIKEPINIGNTVKDKIKPNPLNVKVEHVVKKQKLNVLIIIALVSVLVFLAAFFFAYRAYSLA